MSLDPSPLFAPYRLGDLELKNRVVMAPLDPQPGDAGADAPRELNARYYAQRAGAGLIVTEGSQISREAQGYLWTPGIYTEAQVAGWRKVTEAVHAAGGHIFIQLWHVGRVSHVSLQEGGAAPVAPSAILAKTKTFIEGGFADTSMPRALETREVQRIVADFGRAAANAKAAGFDGVEIHGANGYLVDQFLRDGSNQPRRRLRRRDREPRALRPRGGRRNRESLAGLAHRHPHRPGEPGQRHRRLRTRRRCSAISSKS